MGDLGDLGDHLTPKNFGLITFKEGSKSNISFDPKNLDQTYIWTISTSLPVTIYANGEVCQMEKE